MADYINDIVQKIVTRCDLSGFEELSIATEVLTKKAQKLGRAYKNAITGEERIKLAELAVKKQELAIATTKSRIELEKEKNAMSENRLESIRLTVEKQKNTNATKLAYAETAKKLSQDRRAIQFSKERVARMRLENAELNRQRSIMRRLGRIFLTYFSIYTVKNIIDTAQRLELVQKSIEGLTKSTQDWDYIQQQAFRTGTDIEVVAKGYRNFFSSAKMAGFDKGSIQSMYGDMLMATRAAGVGAEATGGALLALEQMLSKGRVSMEELRKQLGNAIPGAFEIGARAMNMTTQEFNTLVQKVGLASNVFVPKFIEQLVKELGGGFEKITKTVNFASINLSTSWKMLQKEFLEGETGRAFAEGLNTITEFLRSDDAKTLIKDLGVLFKLLVRIITFLVKHIRLVTILLGTAGLTGALMNLGKIGLAQFTMISKASLVLYGKLLLLLAVLGLIQDLIYGIFLPNQTDSLTEDLLRKLGIYGADKNEPETPENMSRRREENLKRGVTANGDLYYRDSTGRLRQSKGFGFDDGRLDQAKEGMKAAFGNTKIGNWITDQAFRFGEAGARQIGKTKLFSRPTDMIPGFAPVAAELNKTETYSPTMYYNPQITVIAPDRPSEETLRNLLQEDQKNSWRGLLNPATMQLNSWKPVGDKK